ncbi:nicalin-1 [Neolamprologus brichardi]|uniref:nicalin-1 n=1 Tax=Neolamprologus brichardi TaxID=32507 RepID=UPI001643B12F|nr:nicalin-1 [Neolamprologus brichardi]
MCPCARSNTEVEEGRKKASREKTAGGQPEITTGCHIMLQSTAAIALLLCVQSLHGSALPAVSSYEFTAYRMQQYNLGQHKYGCRGAIVVAEARSAEEPSLTRRCVIMKVEDFTTEKYSEAQRQNAAAILILLPQNISSIPHNAVESFMVSESETLQKETLMPVYVAPEDEQLLCMYEEVKQAAATRTSSIFVRVLRSMVTATAFQILVINNAPIKATTDNAIITLEGVLLGAVEDAPTIVIAAHYDSFGLAPWLSYGADSNAGGVTILIELARLFQKLYSSPRTRPHEGKVDKCLYKADEHAAIPMNFPAVPVVEQDNMLLEKDTINLVESTVAWEHERYSLRRILGFTLSHLEDPKSELRGSMLDIMSKVDFRKLKRNGIIIAEALARYMYNLSDKGSPKDVQVFKGQLDIQDSRISSLMSFLTSVPRATQLLDKEPSHILLVNSLEHEFKRYLQQVHRHTFRQDKRDPDITFFDQMSQPIVMYRVKPAAFDLFLGGCIAAYLGIVYYAIQNFGFLYTKLKAAVKTKHH